MIFSCLLLLIWIICIAMLWNEGMWTNSINLINILLSSLVAMNYWEPVADLAEGKFEFLASCTYLLDYLCMWFVFFLAFIVLRAVTDAISTTQVKFKLPIEQAGRVVTVVAIGWVMVSFFVATLHTAPLARTAVCGGFQATPMSKNFFGVLAPDRFWLGFVQHRSKHALATSPPNVFDEQAEYIFKYGQRRERFSQLESVRVK